MDLLQQTVPDILVERIRNEIIRGNFKPGERLRLRDLADRYKISTMPVREALQVLQIEGLVSGEARKGMTVTELSVAELEDIYDMRATLEAMATRLAVPNITAETIDMLKLIEEMLEEFEGDTVKVVEFNSRFHSLLYTASARPHLCATINTLRHRIAHYFNAYMNEIGSVAQHDHRMIIEACQRKDAACAAEIMHAHIARAGQAVVARFTSVSTEKAKAEAMLH